MKLAPNTQAMPLNTHITHPRESLLAMVPAWSIFIWDKSARNSSHPHHRPSYVWPRIAIWFTTHYSISTGMILGHTSWASCVPADWWESHVVEVLLVLEALAGQNGSVQSTVLELGIVRRLGIYICIWICVCVCIELSKCNVRWMVMFGVMCYCWEKRIQLGPWWVVV